MKADAISVVFDMVGENRHASWRGFVVGVVLNCGCGSETMKLKLAPGARLTLPSVAGMSTISEADSVRQNFCT
jgi:hypothetical protein